MGSLAGVGIAGAAATFSYLLGQGFTQTVGGQIFHFIATFAGIAGCALGRTVINGRGWKIAVVMLVGFIAAIAYKILLDFGIRAGPWTFVMFAVLLFLAFFCLGFMLPIAGVSIGVGNAGTNGQRD